MATQSQHTPGPWEMKKRIGHNEGGWDIIRPQKAIVATTFSSDEEESNARLLAAAPDLLEAVDWIINGHPNAKKIVTAMLMAGISKDDLNVWKETIAKVKGEDQ
ncbi:MAG: hypothetical protein HQL72_04250 [Magnetococcales bacterium]|nr:hypothetical protein [Magnetococcales bacterium]